MSFWLKESPFTKQFPVEHFREVHSQEVESLAARFPIASEKPNATVFHCHEKHRKELQIEQGDIAQWFSGQEESPFAFAYNYAGHQFGHWAGQLGDGRAFVLGSAQNSVGVPIELALKGAGPTPFSRRGDGFAVWRSSVREYVGSLAMEALGVPTTGVLSLVRTGQKVLRDPFYDGNAVLEDGAIVCRTSRSFLRFGSFELLASRNDLPAVKKLWEFCENDLGLQRDQPTAFHEIAIRSARLVARWQSLGFVHGVLNTDNMSVLGETIDYGPYAFMEGYDPEFVGNTSDIPGRRYSYQQQPNIFAWNLMRLADSLVGVVPEESLKDGGALFVDEFERAWQKEFVAKLGLNTWDDHSSGLVQELMGLLRQDKVEWTWFFRELAESHRDQSPGPMESASPQWQQWWSSYRPLSDSKRNLCAVNPRLVPTNGFLQKLIDNPDDRSWQLPLEMLENPFEDWREQKDWWQPDNSKESLLNSCSS